MKTFQDAIQEEMDQLHFMKALDLLDQLPNLSAFDWYQKGLCHGSIYKTKQAEEDYQQALKMSSSPAFRHKVQMRLLGLYVQSGQLEKAKDIYRVLVKNSDFSKPNHLFYEALYLYETGDLNASLAKSLKLARLNDPSLGKVRCEAWTLCGDLYSAKGDFENALEAYSQALDLLSVWPENWRELRKALILNNLADLYEQFEMWDMANAIYEKAWQAIEQVQDDAIYDLDGYKLEILLSMANFQGLIDEFERAKALLKQAEAIACTLFKPSYYYWMSRLNYIEGLCELYSQNPKYDPFEKLFEAWQLQETFLSKSKASSREYLGRIAYYAAYTYNPNKAQGVSQKDLYLQALQLFKECLFKDPKFFSFTLASICNELGNLELSTNPTKALEWYSNALQAYTDYLKTWPEDHWAQSSLLVVILNLFKAIPFEQADLKKAEALLDTFETMLHSVWDDPDTHMQGVDALERLLEIESLYPWASQRLEAIHDAFIQEEALH